VLVDKYIRRDEERFFKERAAELLELINKAGPTAIKVGQALSVRPDLIPAEYSEALSTLQDRVPPFPSSKARELLLEELEESGMEKIREIRIDEPVAAASIGQVYRGTARLSDGVEREVAIKVQRPDVLSEIALDLHIVREFAPLYQRITGAATDFQSLANEWGRGFLAELDYNTEAYHTKRFNQEMHDLGLYDVVTAPTVIDELSTTRILTTEWVSGVRLDQSVSGDVPILCTVALNAYLVMLLETGCLHVSDPVQHLRSFCPLIN
jgi:predicted unusual protein kinase regulating ubiquinone biosynthesis (AarF/ABC1/UbiB family)